VPFETRTKLLGHFSDHGHQFSATIADDYEALADQFMSLPLGPDVEECVRPQGGRVRYNRITEEYAAVNNRGFLLTYFRPDPAIHHEVDNLAYFHRKCR
jgi:filamentous hemagglutinin